MSGSSIGSIAFLSPWWPAGERPNGIVTYTATMSAALRELGVRVFIIARRATGPLTDEDVLVLKDIVHADHRRRSVVQRVALRVAPDQYKNRATARELLRVLGTLRARDGLALLEMEESFGLPAYVARRSPVPVVVRSHGPWGLVGPVLGASPDRRFASRVRREGCGLAAAAAVSSPSRHVQAWLARRYALEPGRVPVIPNPGPRVAQAARWRLEECDPHELLFVGRFDRVKGADVVVDAFARVLAARPGVRLTFVGPDGQLPDGAGHGRGLTEFLAARLPAHFAERVHWLGPLPPAGLSALRRRAFATIIASRFENFPLVGLEALAHGCPIVSSNAGGLAEIFTHDRNALLCAPADPDGLAAGVLALLADPWRAARLGAQAARDAAERFAPEVIARQALRFYERVLEGAARRRKEPA